MSLKSQKRIMPRRLLQRLVRHLGSFLFVRPQELIDGLGELRPGESRHVIGTLDDLDLAPAEQLEMAAARSFVDWLLSTRG